MVMTLYQNFLSCVVNNGRISDWFYTKRGVDQGAPELSYLYLLCAEILAMQVKACQI